MELWNELPFQNETEIPKGNEIISIQSKVNQKPLEFPFIAPYVPMDTQVLVKALSILFFTKNDILVDLGCGDGKTLYEAKVRYPFLKNVIGVEYDEYLIEHCKKKYPSIQFIHKDMFQVDLIELHCTCMILYLLPLGLTKLKPILFHWLMSNPNFRLITVGYSIPEWKPIRIEYSSTSDSFMGGTSNELQPIYVYDHHSC